MSSVRIGLDNLLDSSSRLAGLTAGARVGLVAHPASVDAALRHTIDRLIDDRRLRLTRLFAPEHGVRGEAQDMETVTESEDPRTGLPVVSLYGAAESSLRPTAEALEGLDAVIYDLQDVGSRYYTFVYTLSYVMEACAEAGIPVVVLDRPNPIGGSAIEGPVLDPAYASFVGRYPIPVRHGMTTAELATMFREAFGVRADLRIVPLTGWRRRQYFEDTGLPWVAPSPNMPTVDTAVVYPGGCLVEGTNLSEGRGTTLPFQLLGAPWIDGALWAETLRRERLPGVAFREAWFRPMFQKHAGQSCHGIAVHVRDRMSFRPFATFLVALREARRLAPEAFGWRTAVYEFVDDRLAIDLLLGHPRLRGLLEAGATLFDLEDAFRADLAAFSDLRRQFLMYPE